MTCIFLCTLFRIRPDQSVPVIIFLVVLWWIRDYLFPLKTHKVILSPSPLLYWFVFPSFSCGSFLEDLIFLRSSKKCLMKSFLTQLCDFVLISSFIAHGQVKESDFVRLILWVWREIICSRTYRLLLPCSFSDTSFVCVLLSSFFVFGVVRYSFVVCR